ncbi:MAG: hypothetical protein JWN46_957, partial [Acidimicrobiales bacterium]|nr:hypothetical protein [Acidimicrobiales bacterium]
YGAAYGRGGAARATRAGPDTSSWLASGGAGLAIVGAVLPWISLAGHSANAFDVGMWALITNRPGATGPRAGMVILLAAIAFISLAQRLPAWSLILCATAALGPALLFLLRWFGASGKHQGLSLGAPLALLGGLILGTAAFVSPPGAGRPSRYPTR